jgi:hypothetical protein
LWLPKREYNAVSAIADEIWQYHTGGNLTIFDKDHDTAEEGRSRTASVLAAKHRASLQLLCTVGGNQTRLDVRTEFKNLEPSPKGGVEAGRAPSCTATDTRYIKIIIALKF